MCCKHRHPFTRACIRCIRASPYLLDLNAARDGVVVRLADQLAVDLVEQARFGEDVLEQRHDMRNVVLNAALFHLDLTEELDVLN